MRFYAALIAGFGLLLGFNTYTFAQQGKVANDVKSETRALLDAYTQFNTKAVLALVDDQTVMYGSGAAEIFRGSAQIQKMIAIDAHLWSNTAHVGDMQNISIVKRGTLESIFFQAPFTVGNTPPVMVRFCMVWKHHGRHWLLVQSSNAVVT